ncbi:MAG TPA: efflux RND transporter periplasmic adaptor subunit [Rhizomicrobium sp.]|nr:efflux RND transporter periplasmic adaptor subunit [Rhizomicrobium sp.]
MDQKIDRRDALEALRRHPEADEPRRRWPFFLGAAVFLLVLAASAAWWLFRPQAVLVHAATATSQGGQGGGAVLNASGYVVAQLQATVAAQTTGMITDVLVQEGAHVERGQVLATLDDSAAQAQAAAAKSQLAADEALVPQYTAQLERDRLMFSRTRTLAEQGAASQSTLEAATASVRTDEALLAHAQAQADVDRKNLVLAATVLSYSVIRAPFAGVVTERYAHPGEMISPQAVGGFTQTGICTIVDMSSLEVDVDVNETLITRLHAGQRATVALDSYPDWRIAAHVITIVPTANQQKATIKVRIGFDKPDPRILPQVGAQVWFENASINAAAPAMITIPAAAVQRAGGRIFVYRLDDGVVHISDVRTAPVGRGEARVLSGLKDGDRVVISAEGPLTEGRKVREQ